MARQIKTFKRKLRKIQQSSKKKEADENDDELSEYASAHKIIQKSWQMGDPHDHKDLVKNLCIIIAEERLIPGSEDYSKICDFVRGWMPIHLLKSLYAQNTISKYFFVNIIVVKKD